MKATEKAKLFDEMAKMLNVPEGDWGTLPEALDQFIKHHGAQPALLALAFDLFTGKVRQVALSGIPMTADAYQRLARIVTNLADQFNVVAVEIVKQDKKGE